jgi:hypothetical protein
VIESGGSFESVDQLPDLVDSGRSDIQISSDALLYFESPGAALTTADISAIPGKKTKRSPRCSMR